MTLVGSSSYWRVRLHFRYNFDHWLHFHHMKSMCIAQIPSYVHSFHNSTFKNYYEEVKNAYDLHVFLCMHVLMYKYLTFQSSIWGCWEPSCHYCLHWDCWGYWRFRTGSFCFWTCYIPYKYHKLKVSGFWHQ